MVVASYDWTCDFCGKTATTSAAEGAVPTPPPGWHSLDDKIVCDEHQITVVFNGVTQPPASQP